MTLDDMQQRLQALFKDKQEFDQQGEKFRQQSLMVQGHINELSFIIQSLAKPAGELYAAQEGNKPEDNISEHQDGESCREASKSSGSNCVEQSTAEQEEGEQVA